MNWGWGAALIAVGIQIATVFFNRGRESEQVRELRARVAELETDRKEASKALAGLQGDIRVLNNTIKTLNLAIDRLGRRVESI